MPQAAANPIRSYCMQYDSMEPTITANSDVIGDSSHYTKNRPQRWDVVVFSLPGSDKGRYVKRIIGLPGETIQFTPQGVTINGAPVSVPALLKDRFSAFKSFPEHKHGSQPYKIPADSVFLIGDNPRIFVADSRVFGHIPVRNIEARLVASVRTSPIT
jgi:signal peptidase I